MSVRVSERRGRSRETAAGTVEVREIGWNRPGAQHCPWSLVEQENVMSLYTRGKSWYYDFLYRGERYTGCIGPVSKTVAKEIMAKKKAEAVEGRYELPSKKPSPLFEAMAEEYLRYYQANRRPRSVERHQMAFQALKPFFAGHRLADISPFLIEKYKRSRKEQGRSEVTINRELAFLKNLFTMAQATQCSHFITVVIPANACPPIHQGETCAIEQGRMRGPVMRQRHVR